MFDSMFGSMLSTVSSSSEGDLDAHFQRDYTIASQLQSPNCKGLVAIQIIWTVLEELQEYVADHIA
jgi:hypothetical protein